MIVNSLLGYMIYCHKGKAGGNIKMVIRNFYKETEIIAAKQALWAECNKILGGYQARSKSALRTALQAHIDDIHDAIRQLDAVTVRCAR